MNETQRDVSASRRVKSNVQEDEEDNAMFLCGGSAEHCDRRLVYGVSRAHRRVLVSAPTR